MGLRKSPTAIASVVLALVVLPVATAQGFSGPWDSAHEPATIANAGVTPVIHDGAGGTADFELVIASSLWCPTGSHVEPIAVTVWTPEGSETLTASAQMEANPCSGGYKWEWAKSGGAEDLFMYGETGAVGPYLNEQSDVTFSASHGPGTYQFFYEVTGTSGVLAQGAVSEVQSPAGSEGYFNKNHDVTECEREHRDIISGPDGNYCTEYEEYEKTTATFRPGGWPAPAAAPPRKPRYPALTESTAGWWIEGAVTEYFKYAPNGYRATHCDRRATGRYRCNVSWRHDGDAFAGTMEVGDANVYTGTYGYGLHIVRTDPRTHKTRRFSVG